MAPRQNLIAWRKQVRECADVPTTKGVDQATILKSEEKSELGGLLFSTGICLERAKQWAEGQGDLKKVARPPPFLEPKPPQC